MKIKLSSRQSELAQFQAYQVGEALEALNLGIKVEYLFRESLGDKNLTDPLWKMPEKGVFTEDFYRDLVNEETDLVVHSWKDLPTEEKPDTFIAATLARADQRDFLLFKKTSLNKKNIRLFSSSPRRALNLKNFFNEFLPALKPDQNYANSSVLTQREINFDSIRGNIPTRIRKWLADDNADGLILAKAAFDRLLTSPRFAETSAFLKEVLQNNLWMVLPLSRNPNAAAQGALAIEIKRSRQDIFEILQKINCTETFKMAQQERNILKAFGGGCHLALGMSCLSRAYGQIEIVKGLSPQNENINIKKFTAKKALDPEIKKIKLDFEYQRENLSVPDLTPFDALYVSKAEAWVDNINFAGIVWASGNETWKKLAQKGVWVHGSNESLGESENLRIEHFFNKKNNWARLSHSKASQDGDKAPVATYQLNLKLNSQHYDPLAAYVWTSPMEFDIAIEKFPELKSNKHICGPGRTYDALVKRLGSAEQVYIDLISYS